MKICEDCKAQWAGDIEQCQKCQCREQRMSERREWWLKPSATQNLTVYYMRPTDVGIPSIRVVELKPGELVISREELLQAFGQAYCSKENAHKALDSEVGIEQARILFGDEK